VTPKRCLTVPPLPLLSALTFGFVYNFIFTPQTVAQPSDLNPPGILIATTEKGVRYLTGGIGSSEREVMEDWSANHDLKLIFAESSGHFLSDVKVVIQDRTAREILSVLTNGPWLYVELSPGTYRVRLRSRVSHKKSPNFALRNTGASNGSCIGTSMRNNTRGNHGST